MELGLARPRYHSLFVDVSGRRMLHVVFVTSLADAENHAMRSLIDFGGVRIFVTFGGLPAATALGLLELVDVKYDQALKLRPRRISTLFGATRFEIWLPKDVTPGTTRGWQ